MPLNQTKPNLMISSLVNNQKVDVFKKLELGDTLLLRLLLKISESCKESNLFIHRCLVSCIPIQY